MKEHCGDIIIAIAIVLAGIIIGLSIDAAACASGLLVICAISFIGLVGWFILQALILLIEYFIDFIK